MCSGAIGQPPFAFARGGDAAAARGGDDDLASSLPPPFSSPDAPDAVELALDDTFRRDEGREDGVAAEAAGSCRWTAPRTASATAARVDDGSSAADAVPSTPVRYLHVPAFR